MPHIVVVMSLDDAVEHARRDADARERTQVAKQQREEHEAAETQRFQLEAAQRLANVSNGCRLLLVAPAKWYHLMSVEIELGQPGEHWRVLEEHRCWVLHNRFGNKPNAYSGQVMPTPTVLTDSGKVLPLLDGRMVLSKDNGVYATTSLPSPTTRWANQRYRDDPYLEEVKRELAQLVVKYERQS